MPAMLDRRSGRNAGWPERCCLAVRRACGGAAVEADAGGGRLPVSPGPSEGDRRREAALKAWPQKARPRAFSIARELNAHPRHVEILEKEPDIHRVIFLVVSQFVGLDISVRKP